MNVPVTAYITSKNRYFTTLPSAILSIIYQTAKPQKFILFQDGDRVDLRTNDLFLGLFKMLDSHNIEWEVIFGAGKGQVLNHQMAIDIAETEWLWRVDDDCFATPFVLETLLLCNDKDVGAVAGLVLDPSHNIEKVPTGLKSTIEDLCLNTQWFLHDSYNSVEAEHLYSTFIFKKAAASHGYCKELSPVGHREETIFTYEMFRKGWRLLVTPKAINWHVRQSEGGIRSYDDKQHWQHDEKVFDEKLKEWGVKKKEAKLIILNNGKGDHVVFKSILPELKRRFADKQITLATAYPDLFTDEGVRLISIAEAQDMCVQTGQNFDDFNIYNFCSKVKWKDHLSLAFLELYK